jgi:hypothetical protein
VAISGYAWHEFMGWTSLVRLMIHDFVVARVVSTPVICFLVGVVCLLYSSLSTCCAAFVFFGRPDIFENRGTRWGLFYLIIHFTLVGRRPFFEALSF